MATRNEALSLLGQLVACKECGGYENCQRCAEVADIGTGWKIDPDHLIEDGDWMPPKLEDGTWDWTPSPNQTGRWIIGVTLDHINTLP